VTLSVSRTAWKIILPVFQSAPMEGSPALVAIPLGGVNVWYVGVWAVARIEAVRIARIIQEKLGLIFKEVLLFLGSFTLKWDTGIRTSHDAEARVHH